MGFTITKTELQKAIESYESKKTKAQTDVAGITDCKAGLEAVATKTEYINMQITAYDQQLETLNNQITEYNEVLTKLKAA
jgi:chromosome segregation ATPase